MSELEKEADRYATEVKESSTTENDWLAYDYSYNAYIAASKPRDEIINRLSKRCLKLERQINIMKTCNNCANNHVGGCGYEHEGKCNCTTKVRWRLCK